LDTAEYSCDIGYTAAVTESIRTCDESGDWTGSPLSCARMQTLASKRKKKKLMTETRPRLRNEIVMDCGTPAPGSNTETPVTSSGTTYQEIAAYVCSTGFDADAGDSSRVCGADGEWTGTPLECVDVDCGTPEDGTSATVCRLPCCGQSVENTGNWDDGL